MRNLQCKFRRPQIVHLFNNKKNLVKELISVYTGNVLQICKIFWFRFSNEVLLTKFCIVSCRPGIPGRSNILDRKKKCNKQRGL